jgi:hypothetical protein
MTTMPHRIASLRTRRRQESRAKQLSLIVQRRVPVLSERIPTWPAWSPWTSTRIFPALRRLHRYNEDLPRIAEHGVDVL